MARRRKDANGQPADRDTSIDGHWWQQKGAQALSSAWSWADRLKARQRTENALDLIHEAIYLGIPLSAARSGTPSLEWLRQQASLSSNQDLNHVGAIVETLVSREGRRRPMPIIGADDAAYSEKRYAQKASRVLRRKMGKPAVERMRPQVMRDSLVRGRGYAHTYIEGGDVHVERVPRHEILKDPLEARYGTTRTLARVHQLDRDVVAARYPKFKDKLKTVSPASRDEWTPYEYDATNNPDQIEVLHIWRLPSQRGAGDGRHLVGVRGIDVPLDECEWKVPRVPFQGLDYIPPMRGYEGHGLVRILAPMQSKVYKSSQRIDEDLDAGGSLKIFATRSANVDKNHLRARHPVVIEVDGPPGGVQMVPGNPMSRDQFQYQQYLVSQMYEISGVSQTAASGKNPLGPNASGKALDTQYDIESDRHSQLELGYAMLSVDIGQGLLDGAQMLAEMKRDGCLPDNVELASWIEEIDWLKFDIDGGSYHLNLEPINFLPDARSGKLDTVNDMAKAGIITDPLQTAALFDEPDIARANRHLLGQYRACERLMEMLADLDEPQENCTPTPYLLAPNPDLAKTMANGELNNAFAEGADDEVLARFRWFLKMLEGEQFKAAQPPAMGAPGAMPGGPPMPGMPPTGAPPAGPGGTTINMPPLPGNALGGMDAQAAAGMAMPNMSQGVQA